MDIRKIEYFLCVVDEASFTKAAKRLHVSQSGISQLDGYDPNIIHEVATCEAMFLKVDANSGVSFFSKDYVEKIFKNVVYVELAGTHHTDCIDLSWLKNNSNAYVPRNCSIPACLPIGIWPFSVRPLKGLPMAR